MDVSAVTLATKLELLDVSAVVVKLSVPVCVGGGVLVAEPVTPVVTVSVAVLLCVHEVS